MDNFDNYKDYRNLGEYDNIQVDDIEEEPTQVYITTFQHVYFTQGFYISKEMTDDNVAYEPNKTHGCMQCGYWCKDQIKEEGYGAITKYLRNKAHKYFKINI